MSASFPAYLFAVRGSRKKTGRTLDLKIQKQIKPSTNKNASVASEKTRRKLHRNVLERIKEPKWGISCKSI